MKVRFEYATKLQYENKALRERIRLLESGKHICVSGENTSACWKRKNGKSAS